MDRPHPFGITVCGFRWIPTSGMPVKSMALFDLRSMSVSRTVPSKGHWMSAKVGFSPLRNRLQDKPQPSLSAG